MSIWKEEQTAAPATNMTELFCLYISNYKNNLFRLAKSIVRDDSDAEDAVSEAILKAYKNLPSLKNVDSLKPWLMKILINECYALGKRRQKEIACAAVPEQREENYADHQELWSIINSLDDEFRTVTILYYYEDLSLKEIAKILELPLGTVKSRLSRARVKLKHILAEQGGLCNDSL